MSSRWAKDVSPTNSLLEYPRPQMVRAEWLSLNGLWDLRITHRDKTNAIAYRGRILVPFPVESALSGVTRPVNEQQRLWYHRKLTLPTAWRTRRVLLHFDAVDWETHVWLNDKELGSHQGGYDRFSFEVTEALKPEGEQDLIVSVFDPTDGGYQPRGKQKLGAGGAFHSACSGIWQTVWLEPVSATCVQSLKLVPDIDTGLLNVTAVLRGETNQASMEGVASYAGQEVGRQSGPVGQTLKIPIPHARLWSPATPVLYDLKVLLRRGGEKVDEVSSYFGMRKVSLGTDEHGNVILMLNNLPLFQFGPIDQGYWPDGIYTAPTDEALRADIATMKQLGFNMCRKHLKIEPERWYYWCDKLGLLVWQDMPSGDRIPPYGTSEITRRPASARQFESELECMIEGRGNHPSIVMWVPFHENWGRYDSARVFSLVNALDPLRPTFNSGSSAAPPAGDVLTFNLGSLRTSAPVVSNSPQARVLATCGNLRMAVPDHIWNLDASRRLGPLLTPPEFAAQYSNVVGVVRFLARKQGLSGAVFSQLTDVESELNGLLTYDRIFKLNPEAIAGQNRQLWQPARGR